MKNSKKLKICMTVFLLSLFSACKTTDSSDTVSSDIYAPYINISQYYFTTIKGQTIDFSNISGYDDVDGLLPVEVSGYIDYSTPGLYYPTITCTDLSGNTSKVIVTVEVLEELPEETKTEETDTPTEESTTCEQTNAKDPSQACDVVLDEDIEEFEELYPLEEGEEACLNDLSEEQACTAIYTNDGTLWGYGRK